MVRAFFFFFYCNGTFGGPCWFKIEEDDHHCGLVGIGGWALRFGMGSLLRWAPFGFSDAMNKIVIVQPMAGHNHRRIEIIAHPS